MFTNSKNVLTENENPSLSVEALEDRVLLSSVQIFATGETGDEVFQLKVAGEVVAEYQIGIYQVFDYQTTETLSADDIQVEFINDSWDEATGYDRNLFVDKIRIDGVSYETENPATFSTGMIDNGVLLDPGFLESEVLNVNGSFTYSSEGATARNFGTRVRIDTLGQEGGEHFHLYVDGIEVGQYNATNFETDYYYNSPTAVSIEQISIEFLNDLYDPENGFDRNLTVLRVQLTDLSTGESTDYFTDDASVYSTGTWLEADGVTPGFGRGNTLHANGVFDFGQTPPVVETNLEETAVVEMPIEVVPVQQVVTTNMPEKTGTEQSNTSELPTLDETQVLLDNPLSL